MTGHKPWSEIKHKNRSRHDEPPASSEPEKHREAGEAAASAEACVGDDPVNIHYQPVDEIQRVRTPFDARVPHQRRTYPLVDLGLTRQDCENIVRDAGLPVPPKSACFFCPFHSLSQWQELRRTDRPAFDRAAELERRMQERRAALGKDPVWMTDLGARHKIALADLVAHDQLTLLERDENIDNCDEGWCFA